MRWPRVTGVLGWMVALLLVPTIAARADLLLSVTTDAPDPGHISVGETIHIGLEVSGISSPAELVSLSDRMEIDSAIFDVTQVTVGPVVPDPLSDPLDLIIL